MPVSRKERAEPKHKFNTDDLPTVDIRLNPVPYFAYRSDDPNFKALLFLGKTPEDAFQHARAYATVYYKGKSNVNIIVEE